MEQARGQDPPIIRVADGVWAQVEDRSAALPPHLDSSAHIGRIRPCTGWHGTCRPLLESMTGLVAYQVILLGTRLDCRDQHDYQRRFTGRYGGLDLVLNLCRFCGTVEVRDVSFDLLEDTDHAGIRHVLTPLSKARRRDAVLGHYSGRRMSGRVSR